jgi:hypothetical protein
MSFWSAGVLSVVLAVGLGFAGVHAIPLGVRLGVPSGAADQLPFLGFFAGALVGVAAAFSKAVRDTLANAFALFAFGFVMWLVGLLLEGGLVAAGIDEESVGWVSPAAFWLAIAAGTVGLFVGGLEALKKLLSQGADASSEPDGRRRRRRG